MSAPTEYLEIEVKFFVPDEHQISLDLKTMGAKPGHEVLETNVCFDDDRDTLRSQGRLLRLRRDKSCRLTYKSPLAQDDPECKIFKESEIEVSDFGTTVRILQLLGYNPVQTYEKRRRPFLWGDVELCLDIMPFGCFLEIEGPKELIKDASHRLGLIWDERILMTYLAMFEALRQKFNLPFNDITFAGFKNYPIDIDPMLPVFYAH